METTQKDIVDRLQNIFNHFLSRDFAPTNSVYFEKLITHLAEKEHANILQAHFAIDWVDKCLSLLHEDFDNLNSKVTAFMLNFCSLLASNEWIVIEFRERKIMDRVLAIIARDVERFGPSIKLGSIRLLSAVSQYSLGLAYVRASRAWCFLIDYCKKDHTLYVVREARQLLYELMYKFSVKTNDEELVLEMLQEILKPLDENVYQENNEKIMINIDEHGWQQQIASTLDLAAYIFQQTLHSEEKTNIAQLCLLHHDIEKNLWKLTEMTQDHSFFEKIMTTITSLNFAKLVCHQWTSGQIAPENFNDFGMCLFNTVKFCMTRGEFVAYLKLAELNHILWKKLGQRAPEEVQIQDERVRLENQLITFHLMPVLFILKSDSFFEEELFDNYLMKLFEISCEYTLRLCYCFRDALYGNGKCSDSDVRVISDLAYKAIHGILSLQHILERDQAVLVFQALIYALKEFIMNSNRKLCGSTGEQQKHGNTAHATKRTKGPEWIVEIPNVLYAALVALQKLIQRYRITWKESIETICLVNCVAYLLENPHLSSRLAVQALKLEQLAIEHFLSPNMALLVDNLNGSGLVCLGPQIVKRLDDAAWEVRDSTLELVTSIASISRLKFPAFQQFLSEFKICPMVYKMAISDGEPYVRASAFKCLSQMVSINLIWEHDLSKLDLIEQLFAVLFNESEGIVRKEAVITLSKVYDHRKVPHQYTDTLYSTLAHCAVTDLHWEVKISALHFWDLEIQRQLNNQGMIDGTFPTVTFSREYKKIVTLNEKEIQTRIIKAFNELSQRGCLGVILHCLQDETDLEVVKSAVCLVHRLQEKLANYNYESIIDGMEELPTTDAQMTESPKFNLKPPIFENSVTAVEPSQDADTIIDGIIASQDINLLVAACEQQLQLNGDDERSYVADDFYKQFMSVDAKKFIATIKSINLEQLLRNHDDWFLCAESLISLLDDILVTMEPSRHDGEESIFADCY